MLHLISEYTVYFSNNDTLNVHNDTVIKEIVRDILFKIKEKHHSRYETDSGRIDDSCSQPKDYIVSVIS